MKYFIAIFFTLFILNGCSKKGDEPKPVIPDTVNNASTVLKNKIDNQDKTKLRTHRGTLDAMMNLPTPGPIPPHLLPVKEVKLVEENANSATYSLTSANGKAKLTLKRKVEGNDTTWIMSSMEEIR